MKWANYLKTVTKLTQKGRKHLNILMATKEIDAIV